MDPSNMSPREAIIFGVMVNAGIGLVIGLVPLIAGIVKRKIRYGLIGLVCSVIGGALMGIILSVVVAAFFTWLVFRNTSQPALPRNDDR
ncbi:MAG TPA: hypothetical protein VGO50_06510 [Pyrinomonadaceae bacterium]|jgi:hypothetical protein|nr:hypothetical protein [Pyrinomonadaceae bacterium]